MCRSAVLEPSPPISRVELKNPYSVKNYREDKLSVLDIKAQDESGRWYNVEMQVGEDLNFDKRAFYRWARVLTEQVGEGQFYRELRKTLSISFLDFNFLGGERYHSTYAMSDTETGERGLPNDVIELHFIETRKFTKDVKDVATALERWVYFFNRARDLDKSSLPEELSSDGAVVRAVEAVDRMFDEEERVIYDNRRDAQMDFASKLASAEEKGRLECARAVARNLLAAGTSFANVAGATGIPEADVRSLGPV